MCRASTLLAGLGLTAVLHGGQAAADDIPVDVELVLAVDVSYSMDAGEYQLQRAGYVAAFTHPEVLGAIQSGIYGRVAITYVEWGGSTMQAVTLPWTLIEDEASAKTVAGMLAAAPDQRVHGTSISGALSFAAGQFEGNGYAGIRRIIDVSGDGPNNIGLPVVPTRDAVLKQDLIINGLPIMLRSSHGLWSIADLDVYYADCVIGGPGSFVLPVNDTAQLADAIREKLILEIASTPPQLIAASQTARPRTDCLIGEKLRRQWSDP